MAITDSHNSGQNYTVQVGTTPTLIKGFDVEPRLEMSLYNDSPLIVYLGYTSDITANTGFPLFANEKESEDKYHGNIYGITASGIATVRVRIK